MYLLGIDIGGTFTDCAVLDAAGRVRTVKVPSTPPHFERGVVDALQLAAVELEVEEGELLAGAGSYLAHGTTVATNIVVTASGERVALLTTRGVGDGYEMARGLRGSERDIAKAKHPDPLLPRHDVVEITERLDLRGTEIAPLNEAEVRDAVRDLIARGVRSVAVCFLWSFMDPTHERRVAAIIRELADDVNVSLSSDLSGLIGEYERTSTTVLNSYVGPPTMRYLDRLARSLADRDSQKDLLVMRSDGGLTGIDGAMASPVHLLYSGPAAGVVGAAGLARDLGIDELVTFDMGGTSTDVAVIVGGQPQTATDKAIHRHPVQVPMIDIHSVGAGGGSIAWIGPGGTLRVGPHSAGADPGPACYARGGMEATVTDANVVLGYIDPKAFAAGRTPLDVARAEAAVDRIADELGMTRTEAAAGIVEVVNHVMGDAIRVRTVANGADPRDFHLLAFGGGGGLHSVGVAASLGMSRVVVPRNASTFSAIGLLESDLVHTFSLTSRHPLGADLAEASTVVDAARRVFADLELQARSAFSSNIGVGEVTIERLVEMCYRGQVLDLQVPVAAEELTAGDDIRVLVKRFDERYAQVYGPASAMPHHGYELRNFRVVATKRLPTGPLRAPTAAAPRAATTPRASRSAYSPRAGAFVPTDVHAGETLPVGARIVGPALVEYPDTAVLLREDDVLTVDAYANAVIDVRS